MPPVQQPYLSFAQDNDRFPAKPFDPKAVTRASWEPAPRKPKPKGPLVSLNRHPDAQAPMAYRSGNYKVMSRQTKKWIVWIRRIQLGFRVIQFNAALGVLALMILITDIEHLTSWILRISSGVSAVHCFYGIYHHSRPAGGRTPSSSAAYQFFAGFCDLCILPIYGYGAVCAQRDGAAWSTLLDDQSLVKTLVPTLYYVLAADSGLHAVTLLVSLWLGIMFRKITQMPPDMNPLESHLTARSRHKKAKSSTSTAYTEFYGDNRMSTAQNSSRASVQTYDEVPRGPAVPFHHTRARSSISSSNRDSRLDLPSRHYQLAPGTSPRNSAYSLASQHDSLGISRPSNGGSYVGVPLDEPGLDDLQATGSPHSATKPRGGKFTENWTTSQSLIYRTQHRNKAMAAQERDSTDPSYEVLTERYGSGDSDSEADRNENILADSDFEHEPPRRSIHPNPLGSNPATPTHFYSPNVVSETSLDKRNASGSFDIADQMPAAAPVGIEPLAPRNRNSSIQPEGAFYSKPYGELKPATPPIMVGVGRQVSSGNDYDVNTSSAFVRRNVSGKIVEEGRAGQSYGR